MRFSRMLALFGGRDVHILFFYAGNLLPLLFCLVFSQVFCNGDVSADDFRGSPKYNVPGVSLEFRGFFFFFSYDAHVQRIHSHFNYIFRFYYYFFFSFDKFQDSNRSIDVVPPDIPTFRLFIFIELVVFDISLIENTVAFQQPAQHPRPAQQYSKRRQWFGMIFRF